MDNELNTPVITSLVVDNEPPSPTGSSRAPPWKAPFLELLGLLKIIDDSQPTPQINGQRFCFQPSHDLSEISRIFLSVSTSSSVQYDIDIKTIRLLGSDAVPPAVNKLQQYANHVLRRTQLFRDRILKRTDINDSACFLRVDLFTCPFCHDPLVSCVDCDSKVACPKPSCLGSFVDGEFCYEHQRMSCRACLTKNDTVPSLVRCPVCTAWSCRGDITWCAGLVIHPALGTKELAELSRKCEWDCETIVRSHPLKPASCRFCTDYEIPSDWAKCHNSLDDLQPDRCPSQTPLMTKLCLRAACCPACLDQSPGHRCACECTWICDTCFAIGNKSAPHPILITCPRCGVDYCTGPQASCENYIELCGGCKGVILCEDCQEEEELPGDIQTENERPKEVTLDQRCRACEAWGCDGCVSAHSAMCIYCEDWFCYDCLIDPGRDTVDKCPFCDRQVCKDCRRNHQRCPGAMMLNNMSLPPYVSIL